MTDLVLLPSRRDRASLWVFLAFAVLAVVVVAAGNQATGADWSTPANCGGVITVAATVIALPLGLWIGHTRRAGPRSSSQRRFCRASKSRLDAASRSSTKTKTDCRLVLFPCAQDASERIKSSADRL